MEKIKAAVVGYGNVGQYAVQAVNAAPDMTLAGVVRRQLTGENPPELAGVKVTEDIRALGEVDVALLCAPTRNILETANHILKQGIHTVDSFDIHGSIVDMRRALSETAKRHNAVSILSAGWDPGSDSVVRALLQAIAPQGMTYTDFGPGMSMGHSVCAKGVDGVKDALSMTIPLGSGVHRRMVYVSLEPGADMAAVTDAIKSDPYFSHDETHVIEVSDIDERLDVGHGVYMTRKGVSGATHNQCFAFSMKVNNPALTSQVMMACARAAMKQVPGAYTMIELPVIDLLYGEREALIRQLV